MGTEVFDYVWGYDEAGGSTVMNPDRTVQLIVDTSKPVTVERCKEILQMARELSGRDLKKIVIKHSVFTKTEGNESGDSPEDCLVNDEYEFDSRGCLTIKKMDMVVYINDNGNILRGDAAHVAYHDSTY